MLTELKDEVLRANQELEKNDLVLFTWGNVSAIDRERGLVVIKPSGVPYDELHVENMVVVDLEGWTVAGELKPSSDTPTHLFLYQHFPGVRSVVHTHSTWATGWAQARLPLPCYGTTHADYFYGQIPCTRELNREEIAGDYEKNTGLVIVEAIGDLNPLSMPGVLVAGHGPFTWGEDPATAVHNNVVLEEIARMAAISRALHPEVAPISRELLDKHFLRKHGDQAYYGQQ